MRLERHFMQFRDLDRQTLIGMADLFQDTASPPKNGRQAVSLWPRADAFCSILLPYQQRSISFIKQALSGYGTYHPYNGCYLGASPGLGKTRMATAGLLHAGFSKRTRVLVTGPLAARGSWCNQDSDLPTCFGISPQPLESLSDCRGWSSGWAYMHFDIIAKYWSSLKPEAIIVDEAHLLSNTSSNRTSAMRNLSRYESVQSRLLLSATPAPKTRLDLYPQLVIMQPGSWSEGAEEFGIRYYGGHREQTRGGNQSYMVFEKPTNTDELRRRLCDFTLRYGRWDVEDLGAAPVRRRAIEVDVKAETAQEYWDILEEIKKQRRDLIESYDIVTVLGKKMRMTPDGLRSMGYRGPKIKGPRQLIALSQAISALARAKAPKAAGIAVEALKRHKLVVVFTGRKKSASLIVGMLKDLGIKTAGPLTGELAPDKRWGVCKEFAGWDTGVLVGTRDSTGISNHYLSKATCAIIVAPHWNPDGNLQAEGRLLDVSEAGLVDKEVIYVLGKGSAVDRKILDLIDEKEKESTRLMGESEASALAATLLDGEDSARRSFRKIWETMHDGN